MHTNGCWLSFGNLWQLKEIRVIAQSNQAWAPAGCSLIRTSWTMFGKLPRSSSPTRWNPTFVLCGSGPVRPGSEYTGIPGCWHLCGQCRVTVQGHGRQALPGGLGHRQQEVKWVLCFLEQNLYRLLSNALLLLLLVTKLCPTPCVPWAIAGPGSCVHGIF